MFDLTLAFLAEPLTILSPFQTCIDVKCQLELWEQLKDQSSGNSCCLAELSSPRFGSHCAKKHLPF